MINPIKNLLHKLSIVRQICSLRRDIAKMSETLSNIENASKPKRVVRNGKITIE